MNKKPIYWICGILMVLSFGFSFYNRYTFAPVDNKVPLMLLIDIFAARPILYVSLGVICGLRLFSPFESERNRKIALYGSIVFLVIMALIALFSILEVPFTMFLFAMLRQLFQSPLAFVAPGIFLGMGMRDD